LYTDNKNIIKQFPYLQSVKNKDIVYFDNAATTHKPNKVVDAICEFYKSNNTNIHRSTHVQGAAITQDYEDSRKCIAKFIGAKNNNEIIFTSGATESINLLANSYGRKNIQKGDVILISEIEHHSNMLPWTTLAKETGAEIQIIPLNEELMVDLSELKLILNNKVKIIAIHHISNVTGIMQNIKSIISIAHKFNIPVFVDGAQAPSHIKIDVNLLNCDFYCFSGHKLFGPTGVGVLFIKHKYFKQLTPYKTGGQMVVTASIKKPKWAEMPLQLEAGTPNIAGVLGLRAAIEFIKEYGINEIIKKEEELNSYMEMQLKNIPKLIQYGKYNKTAPIFAFNIKNIHHYDISTLLAQNNILVRSGHLCNQGLMNHLKIDGCVRASLAFYNNSNEIDKFISVLKKIISFLK
tara:strand:+ start:32774 stop:33991 length:1218 start_codon:yes stop_codon:yes gene_type:complete